MDTFVIPETHGGFPSARTAQAKNSENNNFGSSVGNLQMKEAAAKLLHCAYCDFTHKESKSMVSHMSTHTGKKPYKCRHCLFSSNWKEVVARHAKARHNGSNLDVDQQFKYSVSKFICRVSDDKGGLKLEEVTFPEDIVGKGNDASSVDEDEPALNIASAPNSCNGDSEIESFNPSSGSNANSNSKLGLSGFRGEFKCELCPFRAEKAFHIDFHLKRHTQMDGADFKCPHCPYWVNAKKSLTRHIYLHEVENGLACPPEEVDFSQEEIESEATIKPNYETHIAQFEDQNNGIHGMARFNKRATSKNRCDACPFVAGTKTQLLYHKQFHRPNRAAYKCPHCSYSVSHQHLLNQHLKVHFRGNSSIQPEAVQSLTTRTDTSKISESSSSSIPFILVDSLDGSGIKMKMYHCRYCSVTNKKKMFIMAHEQLHSQGHNHVYRCSLCIFSTRIKNKYASHVEAHNDEPDEPPSKKLRETLLLGPPKAVLGIVAGNANKNRRSFSYICPDCPAAFKSPGDLKIHSVFHSENDYPHPCPHCTYKAKNKPQLCKHLYVHTQGYVSKRANSYPQGKNLGQKTKTTSQAIEAFRASTSRPNLPPPPPLYVPQEPKSAHSSQRRLVTSLDYEMAELDIDFTKINPYNYNASLAKKIDKYVDQLCQIECHETQAFLEKLRQKSKHRYIYKCPACPAAFMKINSLKFHISLHEYQGLIDCDRCSYSVDYEESLQNHQLLHLNSSLASASVTYSYNHRCPQCPAAFSKPSRLEKHLTLHGSDAKWKCDHCDYAVPYAATLVKHRHVHENIAFEGHSNGRTKAIESSTPINSTPAQSPMSKPPKVPREGEKLYHCDRCPYSHSRRDAVQSHQKRHKSDGVVGNGKMCPHCDYVCLQPSYLREHILLHKVDLNKDLEMEEEEIFGTRGENFDDIDDMLDTSMKEGVECEVHLGTSEKGEESEGVEDNFDNFDFEIDWRDSFTDTHINMLATPAEVLGCRKSWDPFKNNQNAVSLYQSVKPASSQPRKRIRRPKIPVDPNSTETFGDLAPTRIRRQYTCEQCEFRTVNPREFLYHRRDEHQAKVKIVECPYCVYACQYFQKLQRHILLVHKMETSMTPPKGSSNSPEAPKSAKKEVSPKSELKSPSVQPPTQSPGSINENEESNQGELKIDMNAGGDDCDSSTNGGVECNVEFGTSQSDDGEDVEDNFDLSFDWRDNFSDDQVNMLATPDEVVASSQKWNPIQNQTSQKQQKPAAPKRKRVRKPKMPLDPNSTVTFGDLAPTRVRRQYSCEQCNFRTVNPREFLYHRRDDHQAKVKIVECPYCVYACQYFQKLQRHILLVHKMDTITSPPKDCGEAAGSSKDPDVREQNSQPASSIQSPMSDPNGDNIKSDSGEEGENFDGFVDSSMNEVEYEVEFGGGSSDLEEEDGPSPIEEDDPSPIEEDDPSPIEEDDPSPIEEDDPSPIKEEGDGPSPNEEMGNGPFPKEEMEDD